MKLNFKSIRFATYMYFLSFSLIVICLLGFLLIVFIKPYYRNDRLNIVENMSSTIESLLLEDKTSKEDVESTSRLIMGSSACILIYNENGKEVYSGDSLGQLCQLNKDIKVDEDYINIKKNPLPFIEKVRDNLSYSVSLSSLTDSEMLLYGKKVSANLMNYYVIINTTIEPAESYINFILKQYSFFGLIVVLISVVVALFFSERISHPIVYMNKEANKLAQGDYDVKFETNSFSEINDLSKSLDYATDKLSKTNELRKDLVANVSHDIKTPLTMIQAYAEMIRDISGDNKQKREEHLDVILKESSYLNKLVTDMSELSKLQSGVIELNKTNFDLKEAALEVVDLLKQMIESKNINLIINLDDCVVYGDEIKISQVIYNFLSNALKYSPDNSDIEIILNNNENDIYFAIKDNGKGIPEKALPYIWDRYYKVDKNFNRNYNSTGLGLAIAKAILEAHKARYGVNSKLNEGSTFYFELDKDYE